MRVLVIAPHPDDEAIGPGGQIALHVAAGDEVEVVYMTRGELGCPGEDIEETAVKRVHEGHEAAKVLGSKVFMAFSYPDGRLSEFLSDAEFHLARMIVERRPGRIYCPTMEDAHKDHVAAAVIVQNVMEKTIAPCEVYMYEVWTAMQVYDLAVDITDVIGIKLRAIRRHESQVNRIRFDEAALALARFRGELHNRPHGMYAEVFKRMVL